MTTYFKYVVRRVKYKAVLLAHLHFMGMCFATVHVCAEQRYFQQFGRAVLCTYQLVSFVLLLFTQGTL